MKTIKTAIIGTGYIGPAHNGNCGPDPTEPTNLILPQGPGMQLSSNI